MPSSEKYYYYMYRVLFSCHLLCLIVHDAYSNIIEESNTIKYSIANSLSPYSILDSWDMKICFVTGIYV